MLPRQSSFLRGDRKWGCCEALIAPPGVLLIPYPHHNRKHITFFIYFEETVFILFSSGQQRLKGMFRELAGSTLQLPNLRARGVSWWKAKSLGYADLQDVIFATFPGMEYRLRANGEPDIKSRQTGQQSWASKQTGGISLTLLRRASDHSERLLIWDLETSEKWRQESWKMNTRHFELHTSRGPRHIEQQPLLPTYNKQKPLMSYNDDLVAKHLASIQIRRRCAHGNKLLWVSIITFKKCTPWHRSRCWRKSGFQWEMDQMSAWYSLLSVSELCCGSGRGWGWLWTSLWACLDQS